MRYSFSKVSAIGVSVLIICVVMFSVWGVGNTTAQTGTPSADSALCTQILTNVAQHLSQDCNNMDRDHVCYGNNTIKVDLQNADGQTFAKPGDVVPLDTIKSLSAGALNPETGDWGVAVLKVQTDNLAETTAGQAATFILYGNTTITNNNDAAATPAATDSSSAAAVCNGTVSRQTLLRKKPDLTQPGVTTLKASDAVKATARNQAGNWTFVEADGKSGWLPTTSVKLECDAKSLSVDDPNKIASLPGMNAFYFSTNIGAQSSCQDIPPSGMLIQSPTGHKISFNLNGVKVTMGSSLLFVTKPNGDVEVVVIEGQGTLQVGGKTLVLSPSQAATVNSTSNKLQRGDLATLLPDFGLKAGVDDQGKPIILLDSLQKLFDALGLDLPTQILLRPLILVQPTAVPTAVTSCGSRTLNANGTVCIPGVGIVPCNRNGVCDAGEHYYICPEDCAAPIPANKNPKPNPMP